MWVLLVKLVLSSSRFREGLVMAAPMQPNNPDWYNHYDPYSQQPQYGPSHQWQQSNNVAPSYHDLSASSSDPYGHTSGGYSANPNYWTGAGSQSPSSYDPHGGYAAPQHYQNWGATHDSFAGVPQATQQPAWHGVTDSHWMMPPPTPNPEKDQAILDDIMQRLSNYRTPSPTTHAPSRGDSIHGYYANPHEGDHEEQAFLNSVLEDVSVKEQQQAPSSTNGNSWFRGSLPSTHRRYPTALSFRPEDEYDKWNLKRKQDALGRRERIAHLEPASFYRLDYLPSLRRGRAVNDRVYAQNSEDNWHARNQINTKIFGGKLHWVNLKQVPNLSGRKLALDSPFAKDKIHRQLPIQVPGGENIPLNVHITDHGIVPASNQKVIGTVLDGKPFYKVWAVPERNLVGQEEVHFLGVAYLDKEHNTAVDQHVDPLLDRLVGVAQHWKS